MDPNEFRASIQKELTTGEGSLAGKYMAIFPGRKGLWNQIVYNDYPVKVLTPGSVYYECYQTYSD
jgi:hypothetical protein